MLGLTVALATAASKSTIYTFEAWRLLGPASSLAQRRREWDDLLALSSIQGLANRKGPRLYLFLIGDHGSIDRYWWGKMTGPGRWLAGRTVVQLQTLDEVATTFRGDLKGSVVWDERVLATSNLASTAAGIEGLVPLRFDPDPHSLYSKWAVDPGGPRLLPRITLLAPDGSPMFKGGGVIPDSQTRSTGSAKCDAYL